MAEQQQKLFIKQLNVNMQSLKRFILKESNEQREKCFQLYLQNEEKYDIYYECIRKLQIIKKEVDFNYEAMIKYWPYQTENCFQNAKNNQQQFMKCQEHTTESLTNFLQQSINQLQI